MSQAAATARVIDGAPSRARRRVHLLRPVLMLLGIVAAAVGVLGFWVTSGRYVSTDDAYVQADRVSVSTDVSGIVGEVAVHEGEHVTKGQVLFRLDPRQYQIALDGAKATLAETALTMESMKRDYQRMLRDIDAKTAEVQNDEANYRRYDSLVHSGGVTRADYDATRFRLAADQSSVAALREQAAVQLAKLGGNPDIDVTKTPQYHEAQSRVDEAERELDHTVVPAPFDGIVTQVDQLQPGQYLAASSGAFGLVSTEHVWVEAQPKETELTFVKPGDRVQVSVDTYPDHPWEGVVESIAPASGSEFSILPAQNSSGNWVKVVQRVAVRVRLDLHPGDPPLRAGMSVETEIDTGHQRHLADLL